MRSRDCQPVARWGVTVLAALMLGAPPLAAQARSNYEALQTFSAVLNYIRVNYADTVQYTQLVRAAIDGVLRSLDPHSRFVPREDVARMDALARGELGSVGLVLEDVDAVPTVLTVIAGSPADRKGVMAGDRLVAVDDTTIAGLEAKAVELRLAGRRGSKVILSLERGSRLEPEAYRVTLKRDPVERHAVTLARMLDGTTGYVWLAEFTEDAPEEMEQTLSRLLHEGARQLILDLRGNPGGQVSASVGIASLFLPRNALVFRTRGRKKDVDEDFVTTRNGRFRDLPLIVLIDSRSASASEALAGSLQDHDRALLVGRRSFGKALMQAPFTLPAGDVVLLTIGRVLTPSGRFIQRSYRGLQAEQYYSFAGRSGTAADTAAVFYTDAGREVHGGGGIAPDVELPAPEPLPVWHALAADSGFDDAVADSVAATLPRTDAARSAWLADRAGWRSALVGPYLERVRSRLGVTAAPDGAVVDRLALEMAARAADVRWGPEARDELHLQMDPVVAAARALFPQLGTLLASPAR